MQGDGFGNGCMENGLLYFQRSFLTPLCFPDIVKHPSIPANLTRFMSSLLSLRNDFTLLRIVSASEGRRLSKLRK